MEKKNDAEVEPGMVVVEEDAYLRIVGEREQNGTRELKAEVIQWNEKKLSEEEKARRTGWRPDHKFRSTAFNEDDVSVPALNVGDELEWYDDRATVESISDGVYHLSSDSIVVPEERTEVEMGVEFASGNVSVINA